jgi:hypothetical protein
VFEVHGEVVEGPLLFDAVLAHQGGELRVVADAGQLRMEEDGWVKTTQNTQ